MRIKLDHDFVLLLTLSAHALIGSSLLKKLLEAIPEAIAHWHAFCELDKNLQSDRPGEVASWGRMLTEWENDHSKPCSYETEEQCMSLYYM